MSEAHTDKIESKGAFKDEEVKGKAKKKKKQKIRSEAQVEEQIKTVAGFGQKIPTLKVPT